MSRQCFIKITSLGVALLCCSTYSRACSIASNPSVCEISSIVALSESLSFESQLVRISEALLYICARHFDAKLLNHVVS
jgi:hypothetical protein